MALLSKSKDLSTTPELKHFSWSQIVEFSEVDRNMISYRQGGNGDWKANGKPGDGYRMVTVDGEPYWADAIGQIPFAINHFLDELKNSGLPYYARVKQYRPEKILVMDGELIQIIQIVMS